MKRVIAMGILTAMFITIFGACGDTGEAKQSLEAQDMSSDSVKTKSGDVDTKKKAMIDFYTVDTAISDVEDDPVFGDYGRLIFPVDDWYYSGEALGDLHLTYYSNIDPNKTVEIANYMKEHAASGDTIFYDIYTEEEKAVAEECGKYGGTVMLAYGGASLKKNGIYDRVKGLLEKAGKDVVDFPGIMPNPTYAKVQEGAALAREHAQYCGKYAPPDCRCERYAGKEQPDVGFGYGGKRDFKSRQGDGFSGAPDLTECL